MVIVRSRRPCAGRPAGTLMPVEVILGAAIAVVPVLAAVVGRRMVVSTDNEKLRVLSGFDGQDVVLGVNGRGGRIEFIQPCAGRLHVGDTDGESVVLSGTKDRLILLGQIRWIEDPRTELALATIGESPVLARITVPSRPTALPIQ